jgi:hypothetical protein
MPASRKSKIKKQSDQLSALKTFILHAQLGEKVILRIRDQDITLGVDLWLIDYLHRSEERIAANIKRLQAFILF